jgi:hypothetical protein
LHDKNQRHRSMQPPHHATAPFVLLVLEHHVAETVKTSPLLRASGTPTSQQRDSGQLSVAGFRAARQDGHAVDLAIAELPAMHSRL